VCYVEQSILLLIELMIADELDDAEHCAGWLVFVRIDLL